MGETSAAPTNYSPTSAVSYVLRIILRVAAILIKGDRQSCRKVVVSTELDLMQRKDAGFCWAFKVASVDCFSWLVFVCSLGPVVEFI